MSLILENLKLGGCGSNVVAVTTQRGEAKKGENYSQWNLCDYTGDDALRVLDARLVFCQKMGIDLDHLIMPRQTHSTTVRVINQNFMDASIEAQDDMLEGVDALVCNVPGVCIGVNTADCVPIAFADTCNRIIAIAHAGWRGTVGRIAQKTIETMTELGSKPGDISAAMGVSICHGPRTRRRRSRPCIYRPRTARPRPPRRRFRRRTLRRRRRTRPQKP